MIAVAIAAPTAAASVATLTYTWLPGATPPPAVPGTWTTFSVTNSSDQAVAVEFRAVRQQGDLLLGSVTYASGWTAATVPVGTFGRDTVIGPGATASMALGFSGPAGTTAGFVATVTPSSGPVLTPVVTVSIPA